jgi:hypothetical protein
MSVLGHKGTLRRPAARGEAKISGQRESANNGTRGLFAPLRKLSLSSDGKLGAVCRRSPAAPWRYGYR